MPLPLIHHPAYDAATVPGDHRFPMRKYSLVAQMLAAQGHLFERPEPATRTQLARAHAPAYVDAVLAAQVDAKQARKIGFEMTPAIATRSAASCGGTLLAAHRALDVGCAVNLAGGSHHAGPDGGAGFCVFNDVAVAALDLLETGAVRRILVIDLDVHHGDGTALIFADDPRVFTLSVHCDANWPREKPASDMDIALPRDTGDTAYLAALAEALPAALGQSAPDLVFYNAGVDPHAEDRLGLLALTDTGLLTRDRTVAAACTHRRIPLVGVLGGGYQTEAEKVAARHVLLVEGMTSPRRAAS